MQEIKDTDFEKLIKESSQPVLVDFWAPWCGPCRQLSPVLEEVSGEIGSKIKICKMNVDESPETPAKFNIRGIPTLILFKNGVQEDIKVGSLSKTQIIDWLNSKI